MQYSFRFVTSLTVVRPIFLFVGHFLQRIRGPRTDCPVLGSEKCCDWFKNFQFISIFRYKVVIGTYHLVSLRSTLGDLIALHNLLCVLGVCQFPTAGLLHVEIKKCICNRLCWHSLFHITTRLLLGTALRSK